MANNSEQPSMGDFIGELCSHATGVVADGNRGFFERIAQEIPISLKRFPSGTEYNGWQVPQSWRAGKVRLFRDDKLLFDGTGRTLSAAAYSESFKGRMDWEELKKHLVTRQGQPDACAYHCMWQYRPWDSDWAISVPHRVYREMGPGNYRVELETAFSAGEMLVAECHLRGELEETFVFNAHTCHPHQANDAMAGVALLVNLFRKLSRRKTRYSYRLVLGPEHLGTVFYLSTLAPDDIAGLAGAVYAEMPGVDAPIKTASSFRGDHILDAAFANAALSENAAFVQVPWRRGAGNDETVWEAPGWEVPCVEVTRCRELLDPYPQYHTDNDTAGNLDLDRVDEFSRVLERVVFILENDCRPVRRFDGLICLSNPKYDLYMERPDPAVDKNLAADSEQWGYLLDCLLRYLDGSKTVLDIANLHRLPFAAVLDYLNRFVEKGLIKMKFKPERRPRPKTAAELEELCQ